MVESKRERATIDERDPLLIGLNKAVDTVLNQSQTNKDHSQLFVYKKGLVDKVASLSQK